MTRRRSTIIRGYSDCWFCSEIVIDARRVAIRERDAENGVMTVPCCRKRLCREQAADLAPRADAPWGAA